MEPIIYDLSRFSLPEAVEKLQTLCKIYYIMMEDNQLTEDHEKLKKELEEVIPIFKADIVARINDL